MNELVGDNNLEIEGEKAVSLQEKGEYTIKGST
jgi:hypothetical protein